MLCFKTIWNTSLIQLARQKKDKRALTWHQINPSIFRLGTDRHRSAVVCRLPDLIRLQIKIWNTAHGMLRYEFCTFFSDCPTPPTFTFSSAHVASLSDSGVSRLTAKALIPPKTSSMSVWLWWSPGNPNMRNEKMRGKWNMKNDIAAGNKSNEMKIPLLFFFSFCEVVELFSTSPMR